MPPQTSHFSARGLNVTLSYLNVSNAMRIEGCGFELSLFQVGVGKDQRTYPLCPNGYNQPRPEWGPANTSKGLCIECPHADGHPLVQKLTLCADDETGAACTLGVLQHAL